ncbi:MAG: hypothetical protein Q9202_003326 [Teloschistes flavicans]
MPSFTFFNGSDTRRHTRRSSNPPKLTSHAPAVKSPMSPVVSKKRSGASRAQLRPQGRQEQKATHPSNVTKTSLAEQPRKSSDIGEVDVFAFIDNEDDSHHPTDDEHEEEEVVEDHELNTTASSPMSAHHPSHYSDLEVNAEQSSKRQTWHGGYDHAGSFHSDSGISMGSGSGDGGSPVLQTKYPSIHRMSRFSPNGHEPSIPEHSGLYVPCEPLPLQHTSIRADAWGQWGAAGSQNPEAYYAPPLHDFPPTIANVTYQLSVTPPELSPQLPRSRKAPSRKEAAQKKHNYSQLASTVSSQDDAVMKPVYRKFETLNNRILLYLQDEISELEASLEELDATITAEERNATDAGHSPRTNARCASQSYQRKIELTEKCADKVHTYSKFFFSRSNCREALSSGSCQDLTLTSVP